MLELVNFLLATLVVFLASAAIALAVGWALRAFRCRLHPPLNAKIRLRTGSAVYRCRYLGETSQGWTVSAPLQRDAYVPLEVGQSVAGEATTEDGVALFSSVIRARRSDPVTGAILVLAKPQNLRLLNRRRGGLRRDTSLVEAQLNGDPATILDLSDGGARTRSARAPEVGSFVEFAPSGHPTRRARVLAVESGVGGYTIRLHFEDEAKGRDAG